MEKLKLSNHHIGTAIVVKSGEKIKENQVKKTAPFKPSASSRNHKY